MTILEAVRDPKLFAPWFRPPETWQAWAAFLAALFGLPMGAAELELFRQHTGRTDPPTEPAREGWVIVGRRGGKSRVSALVAVYLAAFRDYSAVLAPGERGTVMVLAADRRQARTVFRYVEGILRGVPMLARLLDGEPTKEAIHLRNRISIEVHTASFRAVRGYTLVGVVADEVAFWQADDSANPDVEVIAALRPGMATVPGSVLLGISSPYARRGALWEAYRRHFGREGDPILVWKAPTWAMNPTVDRALIEQAYEEDEARARAEYGAEFRADVEAFLSREAVDAVVVPGRLELPVAEGVLYQAFVDPSGGSGDAMTLALAHEEEGRAVVDLVREVRPPFSPEGVVADFAAELHRYRVGEVTGDRYGAEWVAERFRKAGIHYRPAEKPKSDLYRELLPTINSRRVELPEHRRLVAQLCSLERRTARGGRDSIDHPPGAHDDLANAVAGVVERVLGLHRWGLEALYGDDGELGLTEEDRAEIEEIRRMEEELEEDLELEDLEWEALG